MSDFSEEVAMSVFDEIVNESGAAVRNPVYPGIIDKYTYGTKTGEFPLVNCEYDINTDDESDFKFFRKDSSFNVKFRGQNVCSVINSNLWADLDGVSDRNIKGEFGTILFAATDESPDREPYLASPDIVWDNLIWKWMINSESFARIAHDGNFMLPVFPSIGVFAPIEVVQDHATDVIRYVFNGADGNHEIGASIYDYPLPLSSIRHNWISWFKSRGDDFLGNLDHLAKPEILEAENVFSGGVSENNMNDFRRLATLYLTSGEGVPATLGHMFTHSGDAATLGWNSA